MPTFLARLDLKLPRCVRSTDCSIVISAQTQREPQRLLQSGFPQWRQDLSCFCYIDLVIYKGQPGCSSIGLALGGPLRRAELHRPLL